MAKAAYCAMCGANVYLNDDGLCPQGHPADQLSNHYEVPDLTPADQAQYDATAPVEKRKMSKALIIVLVVIGVLVLCGVGTCVAGVVGLNSFNNSVQEEIESATSEYDLGGITDELTDGSGEDGGGDEGTGSSADFDAETELAGMTAYFFPGFSPVSYYSIGEPTNEPAKYQVVATSDDVPEFRLIYTGLRFAQDSPEATDPGWVYHADSGASWQRLSDYAGDTGVSMGAFAGSESPVSGEARTQIMRDFAAAHPSKIVSDFVSGEAGSYVFAGFDEAELDDWMGDSTSFTSDWELDSATGEWSETDFSE